MNMRLVWEVMDSHLYRKTPRGKLILLSLANFAREDMSGKATNVALARHAGCGTEQVRRYKRKFEQDGIVTFSHAPGRGVWSTYQFDWDALQAAKNETGGPDEDGEPTAPATPPQTPKNPTSGSGVNLPPPPGGGKTFTPTSRGGLPPLFDPKNPTSRGGAIVERSIEMARAQGAHGSDSVDCDQIARWWLDWMEEHFPWADETAWLQDGDPKIEPDGIAYFDVKIAHRNEQRAATELTRRWPRKPWRIRCAETGRIVCDRGQFIDHDPDQEQAHDET